MLTVQREVAERMVALPPEMSLLALGVQFYCTGQIVEKIPAGAFYPVPKVDSAVVRLDRRPEPAVPGLTSEAFFRVAKAGFSQPRKQLRNSLAAGLRLAPAAAESWLTAAGIDPQRRAETLTLAEWGALVLTPDPCLLTLSSDPAHFNRLTNAAPPNPRMIAPETRFTHSIARASNLSRTRLTPPLKRNHHAAEPRKTPSTIAAAAP